MLIRPLGITVLLILALVLGSVPASGKVYLSKEDALQRAFPAADQIETMTLYLTEAEKQRVTRASGAPVDSALYTLYMGKKGGKVIAYAAIEAATVRTLPETVMVVMNPDGSVKFTEILAFFEPEEYKPSARWLAQFKDEKLDSDLRVGGDMQGLTGATLSAQAITRQVRKSCAILNLLLEPRR